MTVSRRSNPTRFAFPAAFLLLAVVALAAPAPLHAQGGPGGPAPGQPAQEDPALVWGARFFDDAIRYVSRGRPAMPTVTDFYAKLDAKIELDTSRQEGQMRMWFKTPSMYRTEIESNGGVTTKILNGDQGWIRTPQGRVDTLAFTDEGQRVIAQLKEDRERLSDITSFLTLQALKGPGVKFRFDGYKTGSGTYAGNWIKITRLAPGKTNIIFWIAYEKTGENSVQATWPGIVRVEGDPARNYPTEDYILKEWDSPLSQASRDFRYPRRIEAYSILKDRNGQMVPARFLFLIVEDIKINAGIDATRFTPN